MNANMLKVVLASSIMIMSSLAGCLSDDISDEVEDIIEPITEPEPTPVEPVIYGNVMVSTYHVGELVKAVGGENIHVDYMSQDNIPVHDYEPTPADIIRLSESDLFFYHGLGLEPWVESTLSAMTNAPPSFMTHTMPSGEATVDYDSFLVSNLCDLMTEGPFESTTLGMMHDDHGDHGDHDDHGDHGDDHDDDIQTMADHDDHDDHDAHGHAEAEKEFVNPENCPADTTIQVFHMEAGEHVLEFESEHDEDFNMAVLKMLGGHAHHHHGHGSGPFEWAGIFSINDDTHTWTMEKVDGSYADPSMRVVLIPTDAPTEETMHSLEGGVEALIEGDACTVVEDGESMTPVDGGSCFEWHVGSGDISTFTINTAGISGLAAYTAHSPYEFEATQHYLKDSAGNDVEHIAEEGGGGHGDHGDHGDDHGDGMCHNTTTHENYESTEEECANAGHMWTEGEDHDDHGDGMCHNTTTHENYESTEADCASAGHVWMGHEDHDHDLPEIHADRVVHTLSFPDHMVCYDINTHTVNHTHDSEAECEAANMMWTAADSGASDDDHGDDHSDEEGDHDDHSDEDEHHETGALVIHIEEEGDYGFALPSDIEMFIVMGEGGHDDHDDHGDHDGDDHGDHDDDMVCYDMSTHTVDSSITTEEDCETAGLMWTAANSGPGGDDDDHDDDHSEEGESEIEADEEEEAFDYDPHSWLDPLSFNAQLNLVLTKMTETFPDGADIFAENAAAYGGELTQLHVNFEEAFGDQGTCATSGADKTIVANHNAYSYISVRYGVDIMTVHGLDPEGEPSPAEVAEVIEHIKEEGITTLYVEEYTDQTAVQSIVEETGVDIQILYTMEMAPSDSNDDYLSMMNKNVQNMISGIGC